jgi:hypothetical protein
MTIINYTGNKREDDGTATVDYDFLSSAPKVFCPQGLLPPRKNTFRPFAEGIFTVRATAALSGNMVELKGEPKSNSG